MDDYRTWDDRYLGGHAGERIIDFGKFIRWLLDNEELWLDEIDLGDLHGYLEMYLDQQRRPYTGPKPPTPEQFDAAKRADEAALDASEAESEE